MMQKDEERPVWMQALWSATSQNIPGTLPVEKEVDQDVVDSLMASELNALSMKEREKHMERLHCIVNDDFEETPEMIHEALVALHAELLMIPQKDAYNQAWHINRQYVEDPKFRLMFLRADRFNPKKAAERLVLFLTKKREFFGEASMVRSVTLNDLTTDDIDGLKAGFMQVLPVRDRAGRLVIIDMHLVGPKLYKSDMAAVRSLINTSWFGESTLILISLRHPSMVRHTAEGLPLPYLERLGRRRHPKEWINQPNVLSWAASDAGATGPEVCNGTCIE